MAIKFCYMDLIDLAVDRNSTKIDCILWPAEFHPSQTPIHVRNELSMDVSPDLVWAWLIRAQVWPTWYCNSSHVRFLNQDSPDLQLGTTFRWSTFWVTIVSTVVEYIPGKRIAWSAKGTGISAYHAWILEPTENGCYVLEEDWNQQGWRFTERLPLWPRDVDLVIANVTVTIERAQQVDFSEVYYVDGLQLLVNINSGIQGVADLANHQVAVVKSSRAANTIFTLIPAAEDRIVANHAEGLNMLDRGQVAAMLADGSILEGLVDRYPGKYIVVGEKMTQEPYAVAVGKGNPALLGAVDAVVRNFRGTDRWVSSYKQHLPHRPVPPSPTVPTRATLSDISNNGLNPITDKLPLGEPGTWLRKIQERGYLIVGVKDNVLGFGYRDPNTDEFSGLEIDLARSIAQTILGYSSKIKFRPVSTQERLPRLQSIFQIFDPILQGFSTLSTIFNSNWWYLGMAGKLPEFLCPAGCVNQQDFIGFDYYWGVDMFNLGKLGQLFSALRGDSQNSPVWPNGFYALIKENARLFPGMEIIIVENGCVPEADGIQRSNYLRRHIQQVQRAHQEGANVIAYLCWSITTNREWGLKLSPSSDFGLYSINLDPDPDLQRLKTADVDVYQKIIRDRAG